MKVLNNQKVYQCEYCGKVSLRKQNIIRHEEACRKNPKHMAICYYCKYYDDGLTEDRIEYEWVEDKCCLGFWKEINHSTTMVAHKCKCDNVMLFNRFHMRDHLSISLEDDGWKPMPTKLEGCCNFKEREEAPFDYSPTDFIL